MLRILLLLRLVVPSLPACLSACSSASTRLEEIYVVSIGAFAGRGFSDLVRELFELHGVILLGISEDRRVVLHPGAGYVITEVRWGRSFTLSFISGVRDLSNRYGETNRKTCTSTTAWSALSWVSQSCLIDFKKEKKKKKSGCWAVIGGT